MSFIGVVALVSGSAPLLVAAKIGVGLLLRAASSKKACVSDNRLWMTPSPMPVGRWPLSHRLMQSEV
jgi:hypothetical protein